MKQKCILVTRPRPQADKLAEKLQEQGYLPIRFPLINIVTARHSEILQQQIARLGDYQWLVFISANAVEHFFRILPRPLPEHVKIAAVGHKTMATLNQHGLQTSCMPAHRFDSEGLLETPAMQQVEDHKILIVRGQGGRELLAETLRNRGATVDYLETYQRLQTTENPQSVIDKWPSIDLLTATSNEILDNLVQLFFPALDRQLLNKKLLVISPRMLRHAKTLGFEKIWLADGAADVEIIRTINNCFKS